MPAMVRCLRTVRFKQRPRNSSGFEAGLSKMKLPAQADGVQYPLLGASEESEAALCHDEGRS